MDITAPVSTLCSVWDAISQPAAPSRPSEVARIVADVVRKGWAASYQVEDLIYAQGCRAWVPGGRDTCLTFGLTPQSVYRRPSARVSECLGFHEVRATDAALLLITMERFGFPVDPQPLVTALLPSIKKQHVVTHAELHVLWFDKERHRCEAVSMAADDRADVPPPFGPDRSVTLPTGYRADVWIGSPADDKLSLADPDVLRIAVSKPKRGHLRIAA